MSDPLATLQNHITTKATEQATTEWGELENLIHGWFAEHPANYARLQRNEIKHYSNAVPLMRLTAFPSRLKIEEPLKELAADFLKERTEVLANQMTQDLLAKASLLP